MDSKKDMNENKNTINREEYEANNLWYCCNRCKSRGSYICDGCECFGK